MGDLLRDTHASISKRAEEIDLTNRRLAAHVADLEAENARLKDRHSYTADLLNTELRENYGAAFQVGPEDDWRPAIQKLVDGVRYGCERAAPEVTVNPLKLARWIMNRGNNWPDHACRQCFPDWPIEPGGCLERGIAEGFVCAFHLSEALVAGLRHAEKP